MDRFWWSRCLNNHIDLPDMIRSFADSATATLVAKNITKKIIILLWIKSSPVARFLCLRFLNNHIYLTNIIKSFVRGPTASLMAKNRTNKLSQLFEELQGRNSESKLITLKPINGTYFETLLSRFGLANFPMAAILDF